MPECYLDLGPGLAFWVSDFGRRVSGLGFKALGFRFRVLGLGVLGHGFSEKAIPQYYPAHPPIQP